MSDDIERYEEHPKPDRLFQMIEPAEVDMRVEDWDEVTFRTQRVPGGSFAIELSFSYEYANRECKQNISLNREAAESLHDRLGDILDADARRSR